MISLRAISYNVVVGIVVLPFVILVSPVLVAGVCFTLGLNILHATSWNPLRAMKLATVVVLEILSMVFVYIPTMMRVLWFYTTKVHREGVRCHIPYEEYYRAWCRRHARKIRQQSKGIQSRHDSLQLEEEPVLENNSIASSTDDYSSNVSLSSVSGAEEKSVKKIITPFPARLHRRGSVASASSLCSLDIYPVRRAQPLAPIIVFLYGGAWGSGRKWYYSTMACNLRDVCGSVVVVPDYPTYPDGTIFDMVESVHAVLQWIQDHAELYGGDPGQIFMVGHSAGAHLCALWALRRAVADATAWQSAVAEPNPSLIVKPHEAFSGERTNFGVPVNLFDAAGCIQTVLRQVLRKTGDTSEAASNVVSRTPTDTSVDFTTGPRVRAMLLFAGPMDLVDHFVWESSRCVEAVSTMRPATDGYWEAASPTRILRRLSASAFQDASATSSLRVANFPCDAIRLYHDADDKTVSIRQSEMFREALLQGVRPTDGLAQLDKNSGQQSVSEWCPEVIRFPYGHGDLVVRSMARGDAGAAQPLVQEVRRVVESHTSARQQTFP